MAELAGVPQDLSAVSSLTNQEPGQERGLNAWLNQKRELASYLSLLVIALIMRIWELGARAMHHDESLHAVYSWYIHMGDGYVHNPMMHGPFQFQATAFTFFLFGDNEVTARLLYAVMGTALVGLPWLLRSWLGRIGALSTAVLLAFSPTMLYFSRFARNDILMAVWVLGIVICIWKYMHSQQPRYLYFLSALLGLAFATKETSYLAVIGLGSFLFLLSREDLRSWIVGKKRLANFSPPSALLLLLFALTLPQWSALVGLLQEPLGIILANTDPASGVVGAPQGGAIYVAFAVVAIALVASFSLGLFWDRNRWLVCAAIFYTVWSLFYTTFLTNPAGLATGMWQSLGYWIAQQEVARGGQPWFYYFVTGWNYEFMPFLLALIGMVWYSRNGDLFTRFLIFWSIVNFFLYSLAGEKMPWLLVNVVLPFILLAGRTLGDLIEYLPWRRVARGASLWVAILPLFLLFGYRVLFYEPEPAALSSFLSLWGLMTLVCGLAVLMAWGVGKLGRREGAALIAVALSLVLLVFSIRAGWHAAFENGDVPYEMLVYTQTSPALSAMAREVDRLANATGEGTKLAITIDNADGFSWPWVWYLRDYTEVIYSNFSAEVLEPPKSSLVVVNARNYEVAGKVLGDAFLEGPRFTHRWWFPEVYRITPGQFASGLGDRTVWRRAMDYWLYRELGTELGHVDSYIFYSKSLKPLILTSPD